jgi:hypothetical protein
VINHLLMILSLGLLSITECVPQQQTPPYEEVEDAIAHVPEQPGDSEQGKRALRAYLEQP